MYVCIYIRCETRDLLNLDYGWICSVRMDIFKGELLFGVDRQKFACITDFLARYVVYCTAFLSIAREVMNYSHRSVLSSPHYSIPI